MSSSSSNYNKYTNNSSKYNDNNSINTLGNGDEKCSCDLRVVMRTSLTMKNPGRRFYGCVNYKKKHGCNYFQWADPETKPGVLDYAKIIQGKKEELERENKRLEDENEALIVKIAELTEMNVKLATSSNGSRDAQIGGQKTTTSKAVAALVVIVCVIGVFVSWANHKPKTKHLYLLGPQ